jgi:hypothetical protein
MNYLKFNANLNVKVRLTDKGIIHIVKHYNELMPLKHHTSFNEYKSKADEFGYHTFQLWRFIDIFGNLSIRSCEYFDINIVFDFKDFEPFKFGK